MVTYRWRFTASPIVSKGTFFTSFFSSVITSNFPAIFKFIIASFISARWIPISFWITCVTLNSFLSILTMKHEALKINRKNKKKKITHRTLKKTYLSSKSLLLRHTSLSSRPSLSLGRSTSFSSSTGLTTRAVT